MKRISIYILFLLIGCVLYSQSKDQNYIVTMTPLDITSLVKVEGGRVTKDNNARVNVTVQYYDGLGRPNQQQLLGITPQRKDLVSLQEYDSFGRESDTWLPTPEASNANFIPIENLRTNARDYYISQFGDEAPHSHIEYERSPLNRVLKQYGPGINWYNASKSLNTNYLTNNSTYPCLWFEITSSGVTKKGNYPDGSLHVTKITDEDGKESFEFKNKLGQVILTRQIGNSKTDYHDTYYVYDDFGNLRYVFPPLLSDKFKASSSMAITSEYMKNYGYIYEYDDRNRCIKKRLPGCDWIYYVYDKGDRLVLTQDGELRAKKIWAFSKYDKLGRVIITGFTNQDRTHQSMIDQLKDVHVVEEYTNKSEVSEERNHENWFGYSNKNFYLTQGCIWTVNYYDNYKYFEDLVVKDKVLTSKDLFAFNKTKQEYGIQASSVQGLLVGSIERIMTNDWVPDMTATVHYYDERGRIIQTHTKNHLEKVDSEYIVYNFTGQPTKKLVEHRLPGTSPLTLMGWGVKPLTGSVKYTSLEELYEYAYDHAGRLVSTKRNGETIQANTYNELGQLINKKQGDKPAIDMKYAYNIRGGIKEIENGYRFKQTLYYEEKGNEFATPSYNGNISAMDIQYSSGTGTYASTDIFTHWMDYDNLNRLETAGMEHLRDYRGSRTSKGVGGEAMGYDKHGNATLIYRMYDDSEVESITAQYDGNQLINLLVDEVPQKSSQIQYPALSSSLAYNKNGSPVYETGRKIVTIEYNYLNLPKAIQFENGNQIHYMYSASGQKLRTKHIVAKEIAIRPSYGTILSDDQIISKTTLVTDYVGNFMYEDGKLVRSNFEGGYVNVFFYHDYDNTYRAETLFNMCDYIGNITGVVDNGGVPKTRTNYYPFGTPHEKNSQRFMYSGKEFDQMHDLNWYDFHARQYDPLLARFTSMDPLAEKYYSISPYAYCNNNPLRYIDPDGMDWFVNNENGQLYYLNGVSDISKMDKSLAELLNIDLEKSSTYENIGADDMFGNSVEALGHDNILDAVGASFGSKSESFMNSQGYEAVTRVDVTEMRVKDYLGGGEKKTGRVSSKEEYNLSSSNPRKTYVTSDKINTIEGNIRHQSSGGFQVTNEIESYRYNFLQSRNYDIRKSAIFPRIRDQHLSDKQFKTLLRAAKKALYSITNSYPYKKDFY